MDALSRHIIGYDDLGFPCLGNPCPACSATALIINEWDAIECLTCSWREFGPNSARADFGKWPDESRATADDSPLGQARLALEEHHANCAHCQRYGAGTGGCAQRNELAAAWRAIAYPLACGASS